MKTYNSPNYLCISMLNVHHLGYHSSLLSYFNFIKISHRLTYLTDQAQLFLEVCLLFIIFLIIICGCSVRNIQIVYRIMFYFILYFHFGGGGEKYKKAPYLNFVDMKILMKHNSEYILLKSEDSIHKSEA